MQINRFIQEVLKERKLSTQDLYSYNLIPLSLQ